MLPIKVQDNLERLRFFIRINIMVEIAVPTIPGKTEEMCKSMPIATNAPVAIPPNTKTSKNGRKSFFSDPIIVSSFPRF